MPLRARRISRNRSDWSKTLCFDLPNNVASTPLAADMPGCRIYPGLGKRLKVARMPRLLVSLEPIALMQLVDAVPNAKGCAPDATPAHRDNWPTRRKGAGTYR